jgi:nucleoside-diphosphate-sugar epimerase
MKKHVVVLGGTGYVGRPLIEQLLSALRTRRPS